MRGKEVYILKLKLFNYDSGGEPSFIIGGVFENETDAIRTINEMVKEAKSYGMAEDKDNSVYKNKKIVFFGYQENWNNYEEYEIEKTFVE